MSSESFDKALSAIKLSGSYEDNSAIGKKLNYAQNVAAGLKLVPHSKMLKSLQRVRTLNNV